MEREKDFFLLLESSFTKEIKSEKLKIEIYQKSGMNIVQLYEELAGCNGVVEFENIQKLFKSQNIKISLKEAGQIIWLLTDKTTMGRMSQRDFVKALRCKNRKAFKNIENLETPKFEKNECFKVLVILFGLVYKSYEVR